MAAPRITIVDVTDLDGFGRIPPCADPGFDHRSCDYWEDADRGSKAARLDWLDTPVPRPSPAPRPAIDNPFLADLGERTANPFAPPGVGGGAANPFLVGGDAEVDNPFAPAPVRRAAVDDDAPRKLRLLARGLGVAGSYAKVLLVDDTPAAYCQFGPLTAYPRAQHTRDLYPALPDAPLPAVITCIATTAAARDQGLARRLVEDVCADLAGRGFAAVETYPEVGTRPDATSAATPDFWVSLGFAAAAPGRAVPGPAARVRVTRRAVAAIVLLGLLATACGSTTPSAPAVSSPAASARSSQPAPTTGASVPVDDSVVVDASLLDVLPATAAGARRQDDPETAADIAASSGLADDIAALAVALYVAGDDYAVVTVARPREGVVDDDWFRDWRDTFDAGVCQQAGGVETGRSEIPIDDRTVHRSTCVGGVVIHHVYLPEAERLISIQGAGTTDLGRAILEGLTE